MAIERIVPRSEVVQLGYPRVLLIQHDQVWIGPAGDSLAVNFERVRAIGRRIELVPVSVPVFVEPPGDYCRQCDRLRMLRVVIRFDLSSDRLVCHKYRNAVDLESSKGGSRRGRLDTVRGRVVGKAEKTAV